MQTEEDKGPRERGGARPPDARTRGGPQPGSACLGEAAGLRGLNALDSGKWLRGETPFKCANLAARRGGRRGSLAGRRVLEQGALRLPLGREVVGRKPWSRGSVGKAGPRAEAATGMAMGLLGEGPAGMPPRRGRPQRKPGSLWIGQECQRTLQLQSHLEEDDLQRQRALAQERVFQIVLRACFLIILMWSTRLGVPHLGQNRKHSLGLAAVLLAIRKFS